MGRESADGCQLHTIMGSYEFTHGCRPDRSTRQASATISGSRGLLFAVTQGHPRRPRMGSLKSPCRTSYWSSIETIALNCLIFGDRQTNERTDQHKDIAIP